MYETLFARNSDPLGRYYTNSIVSDLLVQMLHVSDPTAILDLGAGAGSLSIAARKKWQTSKLITVDIDNTASARLKNILNDPINHHHEQIDALCYDLPKLIRSKSNVDVAISNPPYIKPVWRKNYGVILEEAGLSSVLPALQDVTLDILFFAQIIRTLKENGHVGLIVPDGVITNCRYQNLRKAIVNQHNIKNVIKLPRRMFQGTDAQAHILIIERSKAHNVGVSLQELTRDGQLTSPIIIDTKDAIHRLDYSHYSVKSKVRPCASNKKFKTLQDIGAKITRGSLNSKQAKEAEYPVFHTSNFPVLEKQPNQYLSNKLLAPKLMNKKMVLVQKGDILLARVDRNLELKVSIICRGNAVISDCVYRIQVPDEYKIRVANALSSEKGREWLKYNSQGVSAKLISKNQLLKFPFELF